MKYKQYLASEHNWAKKLPTGWRYEFLGDFIKDTVDNRGRTVPTSDFGIPLIATNCISNSSLYPVFKNIRYVSQKTYDEWFRDGHAKPNDIIFVNKGTPGQICFIPDPIHFCFAQDMIGLKVNHEKINSKYLFAVLRTKFMQEQIDAFHVGTLIPHFKKSDFNSIIIPIPPKKLEDLVGEYYFSISQKIENLQNQNRILERIGQAIFKSWFVDFDGQTEFKDSGLGSIPKGWNPGILEDISEIIMGQSPPGISYNEDGDGIIFFQGKTDFCDFFPVPRIYCTSPKRFAEKNDVLFTVRAPIGAINVAKERCCIGRGLASLRLKHNHGSFLYYLLKNSFNEWQKFESDGTVFGAVTKDDICTFEIIIPPPKTIILFNQIVDPFYYDIWKNNEQMQSLTKIRDTLLPKLMSGERI